MPRWTATGRHVVAHLTGPAPDGKPMWYPRYLTYHLLPEMIEHDRLERLTHVFLIRDPAAVVASYLDRRDEIEHIDSDGGVTLTEWDEQGNRIGRTEPDGRRWT